MKEHNPSGRDNTARVLANLFLVLVFGLPAGAGIGFGLRLIRSDNLIGGLLLLSIGIGLAIGVVLAYASEYRRGEPGD